MDESIVQICVAIQEHCSLNPCAAPRSRFVKPIGAPVVVVARQLSIATSASEFEGNLFMIRSAKECKASFERQQQVKVEQSDVEGACGQPKPRRRKEDKKGQKDKDALYSTTISLLSLSDTLHSSRLVAVVMFDE